MAGNRCSFATLVLDWCCWGRMGLAAFAPPANSLQGPDIYRLSHYTTPTGGTALLSFSNSLLAIFALINFPFPLCHPFLRNKLIECMEHIHPPPPIPLSFFLLHNFPSHCAFAAYLAHFSWKIFNCSLFAGDWLICLKKFQSILHLILAF